MMQTVRLVKPKLDRHLVVPVSPQMLAALQAEKRAHRYRSLAAFVRDYKLGVSRYGEGDDIAS